MNVIPFILVFLVALGLISSQMLLSVRHIRVETKAYEGHMEALYESFSMQEKKLFEREKKRHPKKIKGSPETKNQKQAVKQSARLSINDFEGSKLNISSLFVDEEPSKPLLKAFVNLFTAHYCHVVPQGRAKEIALNLIKKGQKFYEENQTLDWLDLVESDLIYKLLKGTKRIDDEMGYPSLEALFTVNPTKSKTHFSFKQATPALLEAYFSPQISRAIIERENAISTEKNISSVLTKGECETLLLEYNLGELFPNLSFSYPKKENRDAITNDATGIVVN